MLFTELHVLQRQHRYGNSSWGIRSFSLGRPVDLWGRPDHSTQPAGIANSAQGLETHKHRRGQAPWQISKIKGASVPQVMNSETLGAILWPYLLECRDLICSLIQPCNLAGHSVIDFARILSESTIVGFHCGSAWVVSAVLTMKSTWFASFHIGWIRVPEPRKIQRISVITFVNRNEANLIKFTHRTPPKH